MKFRRYTAFIYLNTRILSKIIIIILKISILFTAETFGHARVRFNLKEYLGKEISFI